MKINKIDFYINFNFFNLKLSTASIIVLSIILGLFITRTGNAASFQLSGRITDSSNAPIINASIDIINESTNTQVTHTVSDKNGVYNIIVDEGTYIIKIVPLKNSGESTTIIRKQAISRATVVNFIFAHDNNKATSDYFYKLLNNTFYK